MNIKKAYVVTENNTNTLIINLTKNQGIFIVIFEECVSMALTTFKEAKLRNITNG